MKNKNILGVIIFMIFIIILVVINFFRYKYNAIDEDLISKNWYRYNYKNGYYDILSFNNRKISLIRPTNINEPSIYDYCSKYSYDKKNNTFKLDCNVDLKIEYVDSNKLIVRNNNKKNVYFDNIEDSVNYEFENYFNKSMIDYKSERQQVMEFSQINEEKLFEVIESDEYSKIVFIGDKCTSVECFLVYDIMEKWISMSGDVYYFDSNDISEKVINYFYKLNNIYDSNYFNGIYPRVIVTKNNRIIEQYEVKCNGFNCNKYYKNEF